MKIELAPGDELVVTLEGTDGEFRILYDLDGDQKLRVLADLPDSTFRGGSLALNEDRLDGVPLLDPEIYCEDFSQTVEDVDAQDEQWDEDRTAEAIRESFD